jgi:hypothetical protein
VVTLTVKAGLLVLATGAGAALLAGGIFHHTTPSNAAAAIPIFTQRFLFAPGRDEGMTIPLKTIKTPTKRAVKTSRDDSG